ncbi:MAG: DNA mismatch repair endonuclease MutL [Lachnospiraceae bacterium]|nr:DNA mismatch repair endonuclease MutL [Lachnospiraceae bacterium]
MTEIHILDQLTIDKIAAGEVVERPLNVVKELMENAIDANATSLSVEIRDGGTSMIRITDNGVGIDKEQIQKAFYRHSTSKISSADDLSFVTSLGFRGEALSSIAAVSKVELCTKTKESMTGTIYKISGGKEISMEDAGLPDGTTVIVRDLFYNTPARLKFLKTAQTEAGYIQDMVNKIALSHPEIAIKLTSNGAVRLSTSGNGDLKSTIYAVFGRDITSHLLSVDGVYDTLSVNGYIAAPEIARSNRNFELFFVNGRYVKDPVLSSAVEEAFRGYQMKGTFPFTVLNLRIEPELMDVNVHPAKLEIRFYDNEQIFLAVKDAVSSVLYKRENIPSFTVGPKEEDKEPVSVKQSVPEPFEDNRVRQISVFSEESVYPVENEVPVSFEQTSFVPFISEEAREKHRLIGVIFDTYWIAEYQDSLFIIDQHAAHEKVLYEKFLENIKNGVHYSQKLMPSLIVTLTPKEVEVLDRFHEQLSELGFEVSSYGGSEYAISAVPADLYTLDESELFLSFLEELTILLPSVSSELLLSRIASAACKAAVKGGNRLTFTEANALIDQLLSLDNPYNCPHGRPTIIQMSKSELERKFKRILS